MVQVSVLLFDVRVSMRKSKIAPIDFSSQPLLRADGASPKTAVFG